MGDRLIGICSCIFLAKILNRKFLIRWNSPDISSSIRIVPEYNAEHFPDTFTTYDEPVRVHTRFRKDPNGKFLHVQYLEPCDLDLYFETKDLGKEWGEYSVIFLKLNQNIMHKLTRNPHHKDAFNKNTYEQEITETYRKIFTSILLPTEGVQSMMKGILYNLENKFSVGIHIRLGDRYIAVGKDQMEDARNRLEKLFDSFLNKIRNSTHDKKVVLFLASDCILANEVGKKIAQGYDYKLFYLEEPITHIDQEICLHGQSENSVCNKMATDKMIADLLLLSKCNMNICCSYSNFGKIAAILSEGKDKMGWYYDKDREERLVSVPIYALADKEVRFMGDKWNPTFDQLFCI